MNDSLPSYQLSAPASSGNLGPGYDTLGMALSMRNSFKFIPARSFAVKDCRVKSKCRITEAERKALCKPKSNLVITSYKSCLEAHDWPLIPFALELCLAIPPKAGLGSSSTAVLAGCALAHLWNSKKLCFEALLEDAIAVEGHPDNLASALYGGITISRRGSRTLVLSPPAGLECLVVVPESNTSTSDARSLVPAKISLEDGVSNLYAVARLVYALSSGRLELLKETPFDRIHEPYRDNFALAELREKLRQDAGALWVALSGSGPSILVLFSEINPALDELVRQHFEHYSIKADILALPAEHRGLLVEEC